MIFAALGLLQLKKLLDAIFVFGVVTEKRSRVFFFQMHFLRVALGVVFVLVTGILLKTHKRLLGLGVAVTDRVDVVYVVDAVVFVSLRHLPRFVLLTFFYAAIKSHRRKKTSYHLDICKSIVLLDNNYYFGLGKNNDFGVQIWG